MLQFILLCLSKNFVAMKILYYFRELNTPMYWWQRIHIFDELKRYGHIIITFNPLDFFSPEEANENVLRYIKKNPDFDLFLTCVDSKWIFPSTIEMIKQWGYPTALICWDNLELPFKHKIVAPHFDFIWLTSYETKYLFENWGCKNIIFQTYAANPYVFIPRWSENINVVGFIGSPYGSRVNKINDLINNKINCNVYSDSLFCQGYNSSHGGKQSFDLYDKSIKAGRYLRFPIGRKVLFSALKNKIINKTHLNSSSPFLHKFKSVSNSEMISLYSNLSLSLNITELRDTYVLRYPIHKIHLRAFEIPMSGGLQFASYNEELASYFEENKEIIFYHNIEEYIDKARFYLDKINYNQMMKMKIAARKKAENEHTWMKRFSVLFEKI